MIDTTKEQIFSAAELARLLSRERNVSRSESTIGKWMRYGFRRGSERIKMDCVLIGGQRCSSLEAYDRFVEKLNGEDE